MDDFDGIRGNLEKHVRTYIENVSDERKSLFYELFSLILDTYPNATIGMSYQVPTFRSKTGWVALGYRKDGVSLYTDGPENISAFKALHPSIRTGKGSIKFRKGEVVPLSDLKNVIVHAMR
ncbi:MAG: DUF1801 domain-containing protein [Candidatus Methanofastidiosa archaeon]|nr:DUF1801 domain-containing protein [Candidatus Methanofastidiosa archaeon]